MQRSNAFGQREALVAISNAGPHVLRVAAGTEIRGVSGWRDSSGLTNHITLSTDADPTLRPGSERLVAVAEPQTGAPWRALAFCQVDHAQDWTLKLWFIANNYVLKRLIVERFYTSENPQ